MALGYCGTFKSVSGQTVTYTDDTGNTQTVEVAADADIKLNGKKAALADLKAGDELEWSGDPATSLTATR